MRTTLNRLAVGFAVTLLAACGSTETALAPSTLFAGGGDPPVITVYAPLFVIGDLEAHDVGNEVNFWGSDWWANNPLSGVVSSGVASFKGFADNGDGFCGGKWTERPGNSSNPLDAIPADIVVVVTSKVLKNGPDISGDIKEILLVHRDVGYDPNPGHPGNGTVTRILCKQ